MRSPLARRRGSRLTDPSLYGESWLARMGLRQRAFFRAEVRRALGAGMRPKVFAKAGDSNFIGYNAFFGLGFAEPVWAGHEHLAPVMRRYREVTLPPGMDIPFAHAPDAEDRRPWNSFSRISAASSMGIVADHLLFEPGELEKLPPRWKTDPERREGESLLECEIRVTRPLYVLIQLGTNGASYGRTPEETAEIFGRVIERVRELGPVPVGFTILPQLDHEVTPGRWEFARRTNELICETASAARVPLFNQWLALTSGDLVNHGLIEFDGEYFDGFHLETVGGFDRPGAAERAVDFSPEALRYGANYRNLLVLKLLQELDLLAGDAIRE